MILVFFESDNHSELRAVFESDEDYNKCVPTLEKMAADEGMIVTESVNNQPIDEITGCIKHE